MRRYGHDPVQTRILHQIPLYISATADLAHIDAARFTAWNAGPDEFFRARQADWATRLAAARVGTPSLARIAETWWSTVLTDRNSFAAISALVCSAQIRSGTSCSLQVSPTRRFSVARRRPVDIAQARRLR